MSSPFPLLRLPRLVLFEVFKSLSIREKIKLSLCSKKVSTQINNARLYSQKVIVDLDLLYKEISVHSENNKDTLEIFIRPDPRNTLNSSTRHFFTACYAKRITIFWKNNRDGYLSVIRNILKMFQCKISISDNYHNNGTTILGMNLSDLAGMVIQTDDESKKATINTSFRYGRIEMSVTPF
ncbi:hypothetical protein CRE_22055 [Caenorhabditis remanei]|uniref:F-box domain-containing protein n=1 Tax=Caenorhabditis remanei TaxID=31234 RepID=E3N3K7_CAERE|nr:hypothetical protein CRE_22055 [Caenorhabditis remanei]